MQFRPLHIGMDFNVGHMASIVLEQINGKLIAVREYIDLMDTPDLITALKNDFVNVENPRRIICYPDSTGVKRQSTDASTSDIALLRKAKFTIRARSVNPRRKDRIAAVNRAFERGNLFINTDQCPELTEALEQQVYKENGQPSEEGGLDHRLDALGYIVNYLMPVRENKHKPIAVAG